MSGCTVRKTKPGWTSKEERKRDMMKPKRKNISAEHWGIILEASDGETDL